MNTPTRASGVSPIPGFKDKHHETGLCPVPLWFMTSPWIALHLFRASENHLHSIYILENSKPWAGGRGGVCWITAVAERSEACLFSSVVAQEVEI